MINPTAVDSVLPVAGDTAFALLRAAIDQAGSRIWVTQFIVDARPRDDREGIVRYLLHALADAAHRGVDVRVLLPIVEAPSGPPYDINAPAARFLAVRGVRVRRYAGSVQRPHLHAKVVIVDDDLLMVGNLNWTRRAAELNTEQGLVIRGAHATDLASQKFDWLWRRRTRSAPVPPDPAILPGDGAPRKGRPGRYWPAHRLRLDPHRRKSELGLELYGRLQCDLRSGSTIELVAGQAYVKTVRALLDTATKRILITMLGLRASTDKRLRVLLDSVKQATQRGVDVRVLYEVVDGPRTDWTEDIPELRSAGVPLRPWPLRSRMHMRSVIVDDEHVIAGSTAWTPQSVYLTEEMSVHAHDARLAGALAARFDAWWSAATVPHEAKPCIDPCPCDNCGDRNGSSSPVSNRVKR